MAEGALRSAVAQSGLDLLLDSAGTRGYHVGEPPDPRARQVAREHGAPIDDLRARRVVADDFHRFDLILAADDGHVRELARLRPADARARIELILPFSGAFPAGTGLEDPYYGDLSDFRKVWAQLQLALPGLLRGIAATA
jgi:protein-tyrosine phosphatase